MRCAICRLGELSPGRTTVTFDDDEGSTVVIRHVPAEVCDNCGEAFVDDAAAQAMLERMDVSAAHRSGLLVLEYSA